MENIKLLTLKNRMEELGLNFMAAGFDSLKNRLIMTTPFSKEFTTLLKQN